ncbi:hypothetical protein LVD17_04380 [Fulvivirga ulvae]|uniref:hypothetical protein n=1 Tax=Fulvivirga ulvae TaxID=2904245 RepID=UPI001F3D767D|nr:hypothetical protein [Fulvivirga ulvae]UII33063.1 hypothetical protein LVD17_04380 [Fulvivirga ulvae]
MKSITLLFAIVGSLLSCSIDNDMDSEKPGSESGQKTNEWKLVKMAGSFKGSETAGSEMSWQETITLNQNGTFVKTRVQNNLKQTATGTYQYVTHSDGEYLELNHDVQSDLVASCTSATKELLKVNNEGDLTGTWQMCDGPGLFYKNVNQ